MPELIQQPFNLSPNDPDLPRYESSGALSSPNGEVVLPRSGVLLIDDNEDDAELSLRSLRKLGLKVPILWLSDSSRAIEALEDVANVHRLPRLVLLDLKMPRVDGFEILRRIRTNPCLEKVTVIVMVSSPRAPELPRCFGLGASAHIVKPLRAESFAAACERAVLIWPCS
jgi:two-component system, response regulator